MATDLGILDDRPFFSTRCAPKEYCGGHGVDRGAGKFSRPQSRWSRVHPSGCPCALQRLHAIEAQGLALRRDRRSTIRVASKAG